MKKIEHLFSLSSILFILREVVEQLEQKFLDKLWTAEN